MIFRRILCAAAPLAFATGAHAGPERDAVDVAPMTIAYSKGDTAEERYDDAPFGVDPIVTGPVSKEFRERRLAAGCDSARWPNIPIACYPERVSR